MLNDIVKTSKHTFVYALGNVATKAVGIILIPLYTDPKFISQTDFGELAILEATAQILTGIFAMAMKIRVSNNSIYDVPRAGINIGDGTWGGHIIEFNDVFNTVLESGDV